MPVFTPFLYNLLLFYKVVINTRLLIKSYLINKKGGPSWVALSYPHPGLDPGSFYSLNLALRYSLLSLAIW